MLMDLVGHKCSVLTDEAEYLTGSPEIPCRVTGADGEWLRVTYTDMNGARVTRLSRVESLADITVFEE
jgi:hypothetical protein